MTFQGLDGLKHFDADCAPLVARLMAILAYPLTVITEHSVRRFRNMVIFMAGHARGHSGLIEWLTVRAIVEQLLLPGVALSADIGHRLDAGRSGPVIPMAIVAGG